MFVWGIVSILGFLMGAWGMKKFMNWIFDKWDETQAKYQDKKNPPKK